MASSVPQPGEGLPDTVALVLAHMNGSDIEAALDQADTRTAALGATWLLSQLIRLSGQDPAAFFADLRVAILSDFLRQPLAEAGSRDV